MNTAKKGSATALAVAAALARRGEVILFPYGDAERYDLALDRGGGVSHHGGVAQHGRSARFGTERPWVRIPPSPPCDRLRTMDDLERWFVAHAGRVRAALADRDAERAADRRRAVEAEAGWQNDFRGRLQWYVATH